MELSLIKRTALVTGSGRGMGKGIAQVLSEAGANIIVADINETQATETAELINNKGGKALAFRLDVTDPVQVHQIFGDGINTFGKIDILVNNAGVTRMNEFLSISLDEYQQIFDVNTKGTFICCQEFARRAIDGKYGGNIVNIASNAGKVGFSNQFHYNAAKAAVINMTRNLSLELAPLVITVNAICPGAVETEMLFDVAKWVSHKFGGDAEEIMKTFAPPQLGRLVQTSEIGKIVAFLASDYSSIIRGQSINVDGGATPY